MQTDHKADRSPTGLLFLPLHSPGIRAQGGPVPWCASTRYEETLGDKAHRALVPSMCYSSFLPSPTSKPALSISGQFQLQLDTSGKRHQCLPVDSLPTLTVQSTKPYRPPGINYYLVSGSRVHPCGPAPPSGMRCAPARGQYRRPSLGLGLLRGAAAINNCEMRDAQSKTKATPGQVAGVL